MGVRYGPTLTCTLLIIDTTMKKFVFGAVVALLIAAMLPAQAARRRASHVVLIAIDGWGAYSVPKARIPHIRSVMERGCYTLHDRSVLPSASAINWASMFMGVGTELHGYTTWGSRTPEIPSRVVNAHGIMPTIFSVLREQEPEADVACLYEWEGIKYLVDTLALTHHAQPACGTTRWSSSRPTTAERARGTAASRWPKWRFPSSSRARAYAAAASLRKA